MLDFIRGAPGRVGKREIARAFHLKGAARIALKTMLKDLAAEGAVERGHGKRLASAGDLPEILVIQIIGPDADGDIWAKPTDFPEDDAVPRILVLEEKKRGHHPVQPLAPGDRVLVELSRTDSDVYEARPIRRLQSRAERIVGLLEKGPRGALRLLPTSKRIKTEFLVEARNAGTARAGDIVVAEIEPARRLGSPRGRVIERVGRAGEAKTVSLIAIAEHHLPFHFAPEVENLARQASAAPLGERRDLRHLPLVTIDGEDARDFDDAVWAAPDDGPNNQGGWRLIVAIADVSWYVRPEDALDRSAKARGNSVYFPDRVVPMLPEALSNGWCSLKPDEDRPVLAVEMIVDAGGRKLSHRFERALMRSAARLTYERAQAAKDGKPDDLTAPLLDPVIRPLYGAFQALLKAREARGTLELDLPERRVFINDAGRVERIEPRKRLDSHRLIEEFMIAANVAAAETLERKRWPCMYRIHDQPDPVRVEALREFLQGLDLPLAKGQVLRPAHFTRLLEKARQTPYAEMVNSLVLRAQSQAVYSPENIGHFGLALGRYAHFTSPIRRYSDLLVHRALISAHSFGEGGLNKEDGDKFEEIGAHISATERRASAAERESIDRYVAGYLADRQGETFEGRISGVARFGLFVSLNETGADGLVPMGLLPQDYYEYDERRHALIGRRFGRTYQLGEAVTARLASADPLTGGITLEIVAQHRPAGAGKVKPAGNRPHHPGKHPAARTSPRQGRKSHKRPQKPRS